MDKLYILFSCILVLILTTSSLANQENEEPLSSKLILRTPRSISSFIRRFFGRKPSAFQGTSQAQQSYDVQSTSYFPSYFQNPYSFSNPEYAGYNGYNTYGASYSLPQNGYANMANFGSFPQSANIYQTYVPPQSLIPHSGANIDFHSVLDNFVRSTGLSPTGDHDTAASTLQAKGDTPVFSFKKLYSFPFYLSTDNQSPDGLNLQIPFMKKHIRRMSQDKLNYAKNLQELLKQQQIQKSHKQPTKHLQPQEQQLQQSSNGPQNLISQYIQQHYLNQPTNYQSNTESAMKDNQEQSESQYPSAYYYAKPTSSSSSSKTNQNTFRPITSVKTSYSSSSSSEENNNGYQNNQE